MAFSLECIAETALVDLCFARADVDCGTPESLRRAAAHIERAMAALQRLAPRFVLEENVTETVEFVA